MAERSSLIGAISHDLKPYLTRLRLRAEAVAEPAGGPNVRAHDNLENIRANAPVAHTHN